MRKKSSTDSLINYRDRKFERLKKKAKGESIPDEFLKEYNYFRSLLEITHSINSPRDFNELLELVVDSAISLAKAERGFLMLYRKDGNLEFKVMRNIDKKTLEGEEFKISRTVVNHVLATLRPLFLSAIYKDKKFKISESMEVLGLRMVMCVPLRVKDHLLGLIYVDSHSETESFTKLEERTFEAFAAQASVAIENSYLYDSSVHDSLTSLFNYGYLRTRLEEEISRALRHKKNSISFIMIDIDNFKLVNDSYGHEFGNLILSKVAEYIKDSVRKYDIAARYGGDEFAVLMPDTDIQGARQLAQRLQTGIADLKILKGRKVLSVTVSIGIAAFPVEKIVNSEDVIVEADHALFVAKSKGKNQIVVFGLRIDKKKHEPEFIGRSQAIDEVRKMISRFAKTDATILVTGETGTGKELITTLIHQKSIRADKPFVVVNCGAIPDNLLESEFFGYEKGAFTGAYRQHKGKFEIAQGGTIFLDEISEIPLHLQVKLLRAIDKKEIDRIGGKSTIKVNVRLLAASNRNVEDEVKIGNFRKDLFYRLSVATIVVPPLRERSEDIDVLSKYYLDQMNARYQRKFIGFTEDALKAMLQHTWPGNVRELIHRIERAVIMGKGQYLDEKDLGLTTSEFIEMKTLRESRDEAEKKIINQALISSHWNLTRASKYLGIDRRTLRYLIKKHNIVKSI
jgi:two-component system NtrC family response regulator